MPVLKLKHVVSFSSENLKHPASNILKPETYFKWKCASGEERQASIILQLEQTSHINAVDIGNNGSAFIEVLVGRSSWGPDEEFKVLLVASSFMSPVESKNGKELSRVRMFGAECLSRSVANEQWDQVKVVCTQPYNQSEGYGLSFIKIHAPEKKEDTTQPKSVQLGRFTLKSNSDEEMDDISTCSFFNKRMNLPSSNKTTPKPSLAVAARTAESPRNTRMFQTSGESTRPTKQISISTDKRQEVASALLQGNNGSPKTSNIQTVSKNTTTAKRTHSSTTKESKEKTTRTPQTKRMREHETSSTRTNDATSGKNEEQPSKKLKGGRSSEKVFKKKKNVPYHKILEGVTFALSGYQNPARGNIRDLALSLGAKYQPAWNQNCSHLVCAFANTPKFTQVKGKGKIVKKEWIDNCHRRKQRVNTKSYRLDGGGDSSFESSESDSERPATVARNRLDLMHSPVHQKSSSECDTEDELEKLRAIAAKPEVKSEEIGELRKSGVEREQNDEDLYGGSTEDEDESAAPEEDKPSFSEAEKLPELPDFFKGKSFLLYGDFENKDRRLLVRYITAYSGTVENYMKDDVNYVISDMAWDEKFDKAKSDNENLKFVGSEWIHKCHEKQMLFSCEKFLMKPES